MIQLRAWVKLVALYRNTVDPDVPSRDFQSLGTAKPESTTTQLRFVKVKSLFCLTTPLEHIDFYLIIGYWTSFIWSR